MSNLNPQLHPRHARSHRKIGLLVLLTMGALFTAAWLVPPSKSPAARSSEPTTESAVALASPSSRPVARAAAPAGAPVVSDAKGAPVIEEHVMSALHDFAQRPAKRVGLLQGAVEQTKQVMRSFVGRAIDLDKADKRVSKRFTRTSYRQKLENDAPIHLADRVGKDGIFTRDGDAKVARDGEPVDAVYRESDDGSVMKFQKARENDGPAGEGLSEADAKESAEKFFVENGMVTPTDVDTISKTELRERRIDVGNEAMESDDDYLAQQDTLLRRSYEGKPVINSVASVGTLPGSGEVVLVKLANWTPSDPSGAETIKPAYDAQQAQQLTDELRKRVLDTLVEQTGTAAEGAVIKSMDEGWYQTPDDGLIPVLLFQAETRPPGNDEVQNVALIVNPFGSNDEIWQQGRVPHDEAPAPSDDE